MLIGYDVRPPNPVKSRGCSVQAVYRRAGPVRTGHSGQLDSGTGWTPDTRVSQTNDFQALRRPVGCFAGAAGRKKLLTIVKN